MLNDQLLLPVCFRKQTMRCFVGYYTTKRMFSIRTNPKGHKSFTPSVLKFITSLSFAKLVTWMNVTLLSVACIKIVINYSSLSAVHIFTYVCVYICLYLCYNSNHLRLSMWLNRETWWWWWWSSFATTELLVYCCFCNVLLVFLQLTLYNTTSDLC